MTRLLLLTFLLATAAHAQEEREVEVIVDDEIVLDDEDVRVLRDGDERRIIIRRGSGESPKGRAWFERERDTLQVFRFGGPGAMLRWHSGDMPFHEGTPFGDLLDIARDFEFDVETMDGGASVFFGRGMRGASAETRERIRSLQRDARELAAEARDGDRDAERRLDGVLAELFDARGDARREAAENLRERAREMLAEADEMDAAAAERDRQRDALIDERKRDLLGRPGADW